MRPGSAHRRRLPWRRPLRLATRRGAGARQRQAPRLGHRPLALVFRRQRAARPAGTTPTLKAVDGGTVVLAPRIAISLSLWNAVIGGRGDGPAGRRFGLGEAGGGLGGQPAAEIAWPRAPLAPELPHRVRWRLPRLPRSLRARAQQAAPGLERLLLALRAMLAGAKAPAVAGSHRAATAPAALSFAAFPRRPAPLAPAPLGVLVRSAVRSDPAPGQGAVMAAPGVWRLLDPGRRRRRQEGAAAAAGTRAQGRAGAAGGLSPVMALPRDRSRALAEPVDERHHRRRIVSIDSVDLVYRKDNPGASLPAATQAPAPAPVPPEPVNVERLTQDIWRQLEKRWRVERERRGRL